MSLKNNDADRKINDEREKITREDYENYARLSHVQRLERKVRLEDDPQFKAEIEDMIKRCRELEAVVNDVGLKPEQIRERALEMGPTRLQKLKWKFSVLSGFVTGTFGIVRRGLSGLFSWTKEMHEPILGVLFVLSWVMEISFLISFGLVFNFLAFVVLNCVCFFFVAVNDSFPQDQITVSKITAIVISIFCLLNLTWKSSVLSGVCVGVLDYGNGTYEVVDPKEQFFIDSLKLWKSRGITWYDLGSHRLGSRDALLMERFTKRIVLSGVNGELTVTIAKDFKSKDFIKLYEAHKTVSTCTDDIVNRAKAIVDKNASIKKEDLKNTLEEIRGLSNELFTVKEVKAEFVNKIEEQVKVNEIAK